jgi:hypothetical protein
VHALEILAGWRVVAKPAALDAMATPAGATVLRFAPDDALVLAAEAPTVEDEHAIVVPDHGWSGTWLGSHDFDDVRGFIDWHVPMTGVGQGLVAGVPCKVLRRDDLTLLLCATPYAHELEDRLRAS